MSQSKCTPSGSAPGVGALSGRLKKARAILGKTQPEMDAALGIGIRSWQRYESGGQSPGYKVLAGLARLGFDINWILLGQGSPRRLPVNPPTYQGGFSPEHIERIILLMEGNRAIRALPAEAKASFIRELLRCPQSPPEPPK